MRHESQTQVDIPSIPSLPGGLTIAKLCKHTPVTESDELLLQGLREACPGYSVYLARRGHSWYRLGGVIQADGGRVAVAVNEWVDRAYVECGQNFRTLITHCMEHDLVATRHQGVTLYVVIPSGSRASEFVQIEIDRTQEVMDRRMVQPDRPPEDMEELVDPMEPCELPPSPLAPAIYRYRRKTHVAVFMGELRSHRADAHPAQRFMQDWDASSASASSAEPFCGHWSVRLAQHRGKYGEKHMEVEIVANYQRHLPILEEDAAQRGAILANLLSNFDKEAGYRFAWFFYMVAKKGVSPTIAEMVQRDLAGAFAYLPARDLNVLNAWISEPYFV